MFTSYSSLSDLNILLLFVVSFSVSIVVGIGLIVIKGKNKLSLMAGMFSVKPVVDYFLSILIADFLPNFFWSKRNLEPVNIFAQDILDGLYLLVVILPAIVLFVVLVYMFRQLIKEKNPFASFLLIGDVLRWVIVLSLFVSLAENLSEVLIVTIPAYSLAYSIVILLIVLFSNKPQNSLDSAQ